MVSRDCERSTAALADRGSVDEFNDCFVTPDAWVPFRVISFTTFFERSAGKTPVTRISPSSCAGSNGGARKPFFSEWLLGGAATIKMSHGYQSKSRADLRKSQQIGL
jgi:hypothetical protein